MKLIPFEPDHLLRIRVRKTPDGADQFSKEALVERAKSYMTGPAFTLENDEGEIIGCAGIKTLWPGVGEGWGVPGANIKQYGHEVLAIAAIKLEELLLGFTRVQCLVREGFETGIRFAEYLGFEHEGTLRKYGVNGETYRMYARVR